MRPAPGLPGELVTGISRFSLPALVASLAPAAGCGSTAASSGPATRGSRSTSLVSVIALFSVGPLEIAVLAIIALLVLGPQRLPEAARSVGKGMREMRNALQGGGDDDDDDVDDDRDADDEHDEDEQDH